VRLIDTAERAGHYGIPTIKDGIRATVIDFDRTVSHTEPDSKQVEPKMLGAALGIRPSFRLPCALTKGALGTPPTNWFAAIDARLVCAESPWVAVHNVVP